MHVYVMNMQDFPLKSNGIAQTVCNRVDSKTQVQ